MYREYFHFYSIISNALIKMIDWIILIILSYIINTIRAPVFGT